MHDVLTTFKSLILMFVVCFSDAIVAEIATLSIIAPSLRETLIDFKEIISITISILIGILTIYKIRNERRKKH